MILKIARACLLFAGLTMAAETTNVVDLPTAARWGGGDLVGSVLVRNSYGPGQGPGLWVTGSGGYRVYLNGELLAWDNQPGRVRFVPLTVLPGENVLAVVGVNRKSTPGILVQLDELEKSHFSGSSWKVQAAPADAQWKSVGYSDASWGAATVSGTSAKLPNGTALTNWAAGSTSQWMWSSKSTDTAVVLRYRFQIKPEGFGAATTGGAGGEIVVAKTVAEIKTALTTAGARTVLVPEGVYDFRTPRMDNNQGWGWCQGKVKGVTGSYDLRAAGKDTVNKIGVCDANHTLIPEVTRWETSVNISANKSLIGMGRGAKMRGLTIYVRGMPGYNASNAIFRNLAIYDVNPHLVEARDGISALSTSKVWIDHCSFRWISDGNDMNTSKELTVSWSKWDGANQFNAGGLDPFVALIQNSEITYANNHWLNTNGRVPKLYADKADSRAHLYGNLYENNNGYAIGAFAYKLLDGTALKGEVLLESNYLRNISKMRTQKNAAASILSRNNTWDASAGLFYSEDPVTKARIVTTEPKDAVFTPTYTYTMFPVADLPQLIATKAGIGAQWNDLPAYQDPMVIEPLGPAAVTVSSIEPRVQKAPASYTLQAAVTSGSLPVAKVEFYLGNTLVGTATAMPYQVIASKVPAGNWSVVARVIDTKGIPTTSAPFNVQVDSVPSIPPSVSIAATSGPWTAPAKIVITPTTSNGIATKMVLLRNGQRVDSLAAAPWNFTVSNLPKGTYSFAVIAHFANQIVDTSNGFSALVQPAVVPVAIRTQPTPQRLEVGNKAEFQVSATGDQVVYQWYRNGEAIAGATDSLYQIAKTLETDSGAKISVLVSNTVSSEASRVVVLEVTKPVVDSVWYAKPAVFAGATFVYYSVKKAAPVEFMVRNSKGRIIKLFQERKPKVGLNRTWVRGGQTFAEGQYTVTLRQGGVVLGAVTVRKL